MRKTATANEEIKITVTGLYKRVRNTGKLNDQYFDRQLQSLVFWLSLFVVIHKFLIDHLKAMVTRYISAVWPIPYAVGSGSHGLLF